MTEQDLNAFKKVEALRNDNPSKGVRELFGMAGVSPAAYYRGRKGNKSGVKRANSPALKAVKIKKSKPESLLSSKYKKDDFAEDNMVLLIGSAAQMAQALQGVL